MLKIKDERAKEPDIDVEVGQIREGQLGIVLVSREFNEGKLCITTFNDFYTEELETDLIKKRYPKVLNAEIKIYE